MIFYITRTPPENIEHSGIKGQRWGQRRFQKEDGTWTDAGQERYSTDTDGEYGEPGGERSVENTTDSKSTYSEPSKKYSSYRKETSQLYENQKDEPVDSAKMMKRMQKGMKILNAYMIWSSFKDGW